LRAKRLEDAVNDYAWNTDSELMHLDATNVLKMPFEEFLVRYADEIDHNSHNHLRFAIETTDGKHIGNCTCYNIDTTHQEAEIGILIGDRQYWDKGYGTSAVREMIGKVFGEMAFKKIRVRTLSSNIRAQRCFQKCGFTISGTCAEKDHEFVIMEKCRGDLPTSAPSAQY